MVAHNLAKMQLQDSSIMQQLQQALGPGVLSELDPQQLTNLIWAVGVSGSSVQGDSSGPYKLLLVPVALRRSGPVVPVSAAAAALVDSSSGSSHSLGGGVQSAWEEVPAVAEPAAADMSCDDLPAAAAIDTFADAMAVPSAVISTAAGSNSTCQPSEEWLAAAADALLQQLLKCSSQGVSMALWGFAQLGYSPADAWWEEFWPGTQSSLQQYSPQDLALLMCAVGKLGPQVCMCSVHGRLLIFGSVWHICKLMACEVDDRGAFTSSNNHVAETHGVEGASMCICASVSRKSLQTWATTQLYLPASPWTCYPGAGQLAVSILQCRM
jgi:hypothetical protein